MAVILFSINSQFFVTVDLIHIVDFNDTTELKCFFLDGFEDFQLRWYWIDACIGDLGPFLLIFVGNAVIVATIVVENRRRKTLLRMLNSGRTEVFTQSRMTVSQIQV